MVPYITSQIPRNKYSTWPIARKSQIPFCEQQSIQFGTQQAAGYLTLSAFAPSHIFNPFSNAPNTSLLLHSLSIAVQHLAASNRSSYLQHQKLRGYLTLAIFVKCLCKHITYLIAGVDKSRSSPTFPIIFNKTSSAPIKIS